MMHPKTMRGIWLRWRGQGAKSTGAIARDMGLPEPEVHTVVSACMNARFAGAPMPYEGWADKQEGAA